MTPADLVELMVADAPRHSTQDQVEVVRRVLAAATSSEKKRAA